MSLNFNTSMFSIYTDPTNTTSQTAYTTNPMLALYPSLFAMLGNNTYSSAYALGGLSNLGTMNGDLMRPQWMQDMENPYKLNQFDFTNLFNFSQFAPQTSATGTQTGATTGTTATGSTQTTGTQTGSYTINPFMGNYADATTLAQNYAQATTLGQNYNQGVGVQSGTTSATSQQQAIDETTQKLNMYGISSTGDKTKDAKLLKNAEAKQGKIDTEAAKIAEDLYVAMKGAGTDNDKLKNAVSKINKDNILYVLEAWNNEFSDSMDGESLIESIQNEHYTGWFGHQQEDLENHIADALFKKGQELGLKNESHAFRAKINAEHSAWFTSDSVILANFNNMIQTVSAKDAQVRTEKAQRAYQNNK